MYNVYTQFEEAPEAIVKETGEKYFNLKFDYFGDWVQYGVKTEYGIAMWHSIWNQMYKLKLVDEKEATEFGKYVTVRQRMAKGLHI